MQSRRLTSSFQRACEYLSCYEITPGVREAAVAQALWARQMLAPMYNVEYLEQPCEHQLLHALDIHELLLLRTALVT